jgi:hypothetical protein
MKLFFSVYSFIVLYSLSLSLSLTTLDKPVQALSSQNFIKLFGIFLKLWSSKLECP